MLSQGDSMAGSTNVTLQVGASSSSKVTFRSLSS